MGRPRRTSRRLLTLLLAVAGLALLVAGPAAAATVPRPDPDAPAGASADWLPHEQWVGERWLPFDEQQLERRLHMRATDVWLYLSSTRQSLETLARRQGLPTHGLATRLVTASRRLPRRGKLRRTLVARTQRVLTQPHLAAHMLGHVFHIWAITQHTQQILGVSSAGFAELYGKRHFSFAQVALVGGVDASTLKARALAASRTSGAHGVAVGAMTARENRVLRARDARSYASWANFRAGVPSGPAGHLLVCDLLPTA